MISSRRAFPLCVLAAVLVVVSFSARPAPAAGIGFDLWDPFPTPARTSAPSAQPIKDRYVITFSASTSGTGLAAARRDAQGSGGRIDREFGHAIKGFAATLTPQAVEALRRQPRVLSIEPDYEVQATGVQLPAPSWGLDRIDQLALPLNTIYNYGATGAGVTVYVIDSGIRATHTDFGGRVAGGFTAVNDGVGTGDCNGHGTHVAGTIGGATYGVAKDVRLVPVRVLDCKGAGTTSAAIAGIDWVTANRSTPAVVNMSLGGPASPALDTAVANAIAAGITFVIAAGNSNVDACPSSPARVPAAITVGATTITDARASFSNFGSCLDLFAPGNNITSTGNANDIATAVMSGTSMASPHVAGAAALFLQMVPGALPAAVRDALTGAAIKNVVGSAGLDSPNVLLFNGLVAGVQPAPSQPPPANLAPVAVAPTTSLPIAGTQMGASTVPLTVGWSAVDRDGDGIASYQLEESLDGGATWTRPTLPTPKATNLTVSRGTSPSLRYRVRATDGRGLAGAFATAPAAALSLVQQSAATFGAAKAWVDNPVTGAFGGTAQRSLTAGATSTFTFTGTQVAWLATKAANRGKAEVFLDGVGQGVVDLYAATTKPRQVLFSRGVGAGSHTLTIKVLGTRQAASSAAYVDVDGFLTVK
jgi:subtilisin family serine protease